MADPIPLPEKLTEILEVKSELNAWERDYVEHLVKRLGRGIHLTVKQQETLESIWQKCFE